MSTDKRPSREELQQQIEDATKAIEEMGNDRYSMAPNKLEETPEVDQPQEEIPIEEVNQEIEEKPEEVIEEPVKEEEIAAEDVEEEILKQEVKKQEEIKKEAEKNHENDYEKRFKDSSREAQKLAEQKKELESLIDEAYQLPEPSEDELKTAFQNWDTLTDFEKQMAKDNLHNKNINNRIREIRQFQRENENKVKEYVKQVELFAIDPSNLKKFPLLDGHQNELKEFASNIKRTSMDVEDLVQLFLVKNVTPFIKTNNKGQMFPTGTGGDKQAKTGPKLLSLAQANELMKKDYRAYKEAVRNKQIDYSTI